MVLPKNSSVKCAPALQLASLAAQLAKLSAELVEVATNFIVESPTADRSFSTETRHEATASGLSSSPSSRSKPASKAEVVASVKAAREVIGQFNRPVQISVLYKEISARGFAINTVRPVLTYGARLRDYRKRVGLTYLDGFGWWLKERPFPAANHASANVARIGKHII